MLTPPSPAELPDTLCRSTLRLLQEEYPGITRMWPVMQWVLLEDQKLRTLAEFIRYNIPKAYYTQDISEFDQLIQDAYLEHQHPCSEQEDPSFEDQLSELEAQIGKLARRISPTSDEDEVNINVNRTLVQQRAQLRQQTPYSIESVHNFISLFNGLSDQAKVNLDLISQIQTANSWKKQKAFLEINNNNPHEKYSLASSMGSKSNRYYNKELHNSRKIYTKLPKQRQEREIVITLGDKIPLETKELRNYIKKMSQSSFSVISQQMELNKNALQKHKTSIDLALNIVTRENMHSIYADMEQLISESEELGHYLIDQTLTKCIEQNKLAGLYIEFLVLFTKISTCAFKWQWRDSHLHNRVSINAMHRVLVDKIQHIFCSEVTNPDSHKKVKHICFIVGALIEKRKLSAKVFKQVLNKVLQQLIVSFKEGNKQTQESYFEAIIHFIESLGQFYDCKIAQINVNSLLFPENSTELKRILSRDCANTMKHMLLDLATCFQFKTTRVECLIKNLFERKQKIQQQLLQKQQIQSLEVSEHKIRQLFEEKEGILTLISLYESAGNQATMFTKILLALLDNTRPKVEQAIQQFLIHFLPVRLPSSRLLEYWHYSYFSFVLMECDLPQMIYGLTLIFGQILKGAKSGQLQASDFICQCDSDFDDADEEDTTHFMSKLETSLQKYML